MNEFSSGTTYHCYSTDEMIALGRTFAHLTPPWVLALVGDLGTGKTTFVKGLAEGLKCYDEASSPTFSLVHPYEGENPLIHCDWYRLNSSSELDRIGWYELVDTNDRIAIEWADKFPDQVPSLAIYLHFKIEQNVHIVQLGKNW